MFKEFKEFAMRGSVLDMAIALDATRCPGCTSEVPTAA